MIDKKILDIYTGINTINMRAISSAASVAAFNDSIRKIADSDSINIQKKILAQYHGLGSLHIQDIWSAKSAAVFNDNIRKIVDSGAADIQKKILSRYVGLGSLDISSMHSAITASAVFNEALSLYRTFDIPEITNVMKQVTVTPELFQAIQDLNVSTAANFEVIKNGNVPSGNQTLNFFDYLKTIPEKSRDGIIWLFILFLLEVVWDVSINIVSNAVQPKVDEYILSNPNASDNGIRKISSKLNINLEHMRFVTGDRINIRMSFNQKSEIIDQLNRGDIVTFIRKDSSLNWSLIRYKNDDNEVIEGWINSRYLKRLNDKR